MSADNSSGPLVTRSFVVLTATSLVFFVAAGVVLPVVAPFATGPLGSDEVGAGFAYGAFSIAALLLRPVVGWAADRFGRRPLLIVGALISVGALAFHLVVDSLALFIVARAILGIAEAFFFVAVIAAGADLSPPNRRGEALNLLSLSVYVGVGIGPAIGELVLRAGGFSAVWLVALVLTLGAAAMVRVVPETSPTVLKAGSGDVPRSRLFHPAGVFPGLLILAGTSGMAGFLAFLPLHATSVGMEGAGLPLALYAALVIGLRVIFAKLPDQIGSVRLSGGALAVGAIGLAILGLAPTPTGVILGTLTFASGIAFLMPGLLTLAVSRVSEMERGSVVGTASAFLDLAFGLAPAVLGILAARVGFGGVFLASAVASALGFVALIGWSRTVGPQRRATLPA
ncbi:MAG TPA: MFS transporter [Candidatus Limnocylindrales bacterium]|jgi:MFS family permease|nr:MFS transporter [Candidatus Limnocylindrales bacterium]